MAGVQGIGPLIRKFRKGKPKVKSLYETGSAKAVSDSGASEIAVEELAQKKMREDRMPSEQAYDEAERAVGQHVEGEPLPKSGVWSRLKTGVDDDLNPVIPGKTKAMAAGATGAGAAGLALQGDEVPFDGLDLGKEPKKIEDKSDKEQKKDSNEADKVIDDDKTKIDKAIQKLIDGADAGSAGYPMPGAYRPYKFNRTDFSESLKGDLETIGSKYEAELDGLNDKEAAGKDRAVMKSLLKGLIDAAALMYLAKHAPTAQYTSQTDKGEYDRELARLDTHMNTQRNLVKEKFAELRAQTKARYRTEENREDQASQDQYRDYQGRQQYEKDKLRAITAMSQGLTSAKGKRDSLRLKELQDARKRIQKIEDEGGKPSKPDITVKQQADLENKNKAAIKDFIIYSGSSDSETLAAELRNMGATATEIDTFIKAKEEGFIESPEDALKFLPTSRDLMNRQLSGIRGTESVQSARTTKMIKGKLHSKVPGGWVPVD